MSPYILRTTRSGMLATFWTIVESLSTCALSGSGSLDTKSYEEALTHHGADILIFISASFLSLWTNVDNSPLHEGVRQIIVTT